MFVMWKQQNKTDKSLHVYIDNLVQFLYSVIKIKSQITKHDE